MTRTGMVEKTAADHMPTLRPKYRSPKVPTDKAARTSMSQCIIWASDPPRRARPAAKIRFMLPGYRDPVMVGSKLRWPFCRKILGRASW